MGICIVVWVSFYYNSNFFIGLHSRDFFLRQKQTSLFIKRDAVNQFQGIVFHSPPPHILVPHQLAGVVQGWRHQCGHPCWSSHSNSYKGTWHAQEHFGRRYRGEAEGRKMSSKASNVATIQVRVRSWLWSDRPPSCGFLIRSTHCIIWWVPW